MKMSFKLYIDLNQVMAIFCVIILAMINFIITKMKSSFQLKSRKKEFSLNEIIIFTYSSDKPVDSQTGLG